jgi:hypothetical protein
MSILIVSSFYDLSLEAIKKLFASVLLFIMPPLLYCESRNFLKKNSVLGTSKQQLALSYPKNEGKMFNS